MTDIHSALSDAMRRLQWAKDDDFFVANGHVFWGKPSAGSWIGMHDNMRVVSDAVNPEALAATLNAAIADDKARRIAKCEADVKAARQAVLDAAA